MVPTSASIAGLALLLLCACRGGRDPQPASAPAPVTPPNAPGALTATPSARGIELSWADNSLDETGFLIERSENDGGFELLGATSQDVRSFADTQPQASTLYVYRVRAENDGGTSEPSNTVRVETPDAQARGCGLQIAGDFGDGRAEATASAGAPTNLHYSMWTVYRGAQVTVAEQTAAPSTAGLTLDGGAAGTAWLTQRIDPGPDAIELLLELRFSALTAAEDGKRGEFCLTLHDEGSARSSTLASERPRVTVDLPMGQTLPVQAEHVYPVRIRYDRTRAVFSIALHGLVLAADVPRDAALFLPVHYEH